MSLDMARSPIFQSSRPVAPDAPLDSLFEEQSEPEPQQQVEEPAAGFDLENDDLSDEDFDASLGAIQERILVANYLQLLLTAPLFGDDQSHAAQLVLARVRTLVRREAEIVLGIRGEREKEAVASVFTDDEVRALKLIASRALAPREPAVTPVSPPPPPKVTPAAQPSKPKVVPVRAASPAPKPTATPPKPFRPKTAQATAPAAPRPEAQGVQKVGGVVNSNGRMKRTLEFPDQNVKIVQDLTPQQVPLNRVPMPQGPQLSVITEIQANETVAAQGESATLSRLAALRS